jgi:tRNA (mo5U34)-methyltransferase
VTMQPDARTPSPQEARDFVDASTFPWHQRWEIAPDVVTPGANDIDWLLHHVGLPADLSGCSVLDIGTTNGAGAFVAERRGASRVVAVDIFPPEYYGFSDIAELLGSGAEYVRASIYGLAELLGERFDLVLFLGVLYHLRHPLLALDEVRALTRGATLLETAVSDHELGERSGEALARFYRRDELGGDPSNWFAPTARALVDWCTSCGFDTKLIDAWPHAAPERAAVRCVPTAGEPEWRDMSYERPLRVDVEGSLSDRW